MAEPARLDRGHKTHADGRGTQMRMSAPSERSSPLPRIALASGPSGVIDLLLTVQRLAGNAATQEALDRGAVQRQAASVPASVAPAPVSTMPAPPPAMTPAAPAVPQVTAEDTKLLLDIEVARQIKEQVARDRRIAATPGLPLKLPPELGGEAKGPDTRLESATVQDMLTSIGLSRLNQIPDLYDRFRLRFAELTRQVSYYLLDQNALLANQEARRYRKGQEGDPVGLRAAAVEIARKVEEQRPVQLSYARSVPPGGTMPSLDATPAGQDLKKKNAELQTLKGLHGSRFPILLAEDLDYQAISTATDAHLGELLNGSVAPVIENIRKSRVNLDKGLLEPLGLPPVVTETRKLLGIGPGSEPDLIIDRDERARAAVSEQKTIAMSALAITLGLLAAIPTGGLTIVGLAAVTGAGIGAAALSVAGLGEQFGEYHVKKAAAGSAIDSAAAISSEEPSLLWLAVSIAGAVLDVHAAFGAFRMMAQAIRGAKTVEEISEAAHKTASSLKGKYVQGMDEATVASRILAGAEKNLLKGSAAEMARKGIVQEAVKNGRLHGRLIALWDDAACTELLRAHGNWKSLIEELHASGDAGKKIADGLQKHRQRVLQTLERKFGAKPLEEASTAAISDVDLNIGGVHAGESVLAAEAHMAKEFGPRWADAYRMAFYTDRGRLLAYRAFEQMAPAQKAAYLEKILKEVTPRATLLNEAKSLAHAGENAAAVAAVRQRAQALGLDFEEVRRQALRLTGGDSAAERAKLLKKVDALMAKFEAPTLAEAKRLELAREIVLAQMEANFFSREAYIGPAAMLGLKDLRHGLEAFTAAHSQLEMIGHILAESGHDVATAMREYEVYKYINRLAEVAKLAGAADPELEAFAHISEYVYRTHRTAVRGAPAAEEVLAGATRYRKATADEIAEATKGGTRPLPGLTKSGELVEPVPKKSPGDPEQGRIAAGFYIRPADVTPAGPGPSPEVLQRLYGRFNQRANELLPRLKEFGETGTLPPPRTAPVGTPAVPEFPSLGPAPRGAPPPTPTTPPPTATVPPEALPPTVRPGRGISGPARIIDHSEGNVYHVVDSADDWFHAWAKVDDEGRLEISMRTKKPTGQASTVINAEEQFARIKDFYEKKSVKAIRANWSYETNLDLFNRAIQRGQTPEQAAFKTVEGFQATKAGFTKVQIESLEGEPGHYTSVKLLFKKPG